MNKYSDKELIQMLKSESNKTVDTGLAHLYQVSKKTVAGFILRNKGNDQDVSDIFHDGLIAFYKLVIQVRRQTLSALLCRNTDNVEALPRHAMDVVSGTNPLVACADLPLWDYEAWSEPS